MCISPENKLISDKTNYFENGIKATYSLNCVLYNVCQTWQLLAEGTCIKRIIVQISYLLLSRRRKICLICARIKEKESNYEAQPHLYAKLKNVFKDIYCTI